MAEAAVEPVSAREEPSLTAEEERVLLTARSLHDDDVHERRNTPWQAHLPLGVIPVAEASIGIVTSTPCGTRAVCYDTHSVREAGGGCDHSHILLKATDAARWREAVVRIECVPKVKPASPRYNVHAITG
jgi:hypothetical protein